MRGNYNLMHAISSYFYLCEDNAGGGRTGGCPVAIGSDSVDLVGSGRLWFVGCGNYWWWYDHDGRVLERVLKMVSAQESDQTRSTAACLIVD